MATVDCFTTAEMLVVPPLAGTLDGFRAWVESDEFPEKGRAAYVRGRLFIEMSPERIETHTKLKDQISRVIGNIIADLDLGDFYGDRARITNDSAGLSNEPDAMFASWETLESGKLAPPKDRPQDGTHVELVGTPDWVLEVVSDGSVDKDTRHLREAYHKAGIAEYWLVDARGEGIDFQLLVWQPNGYQAATPEEGWLESPVFGRRFRLTRSRDRLNRWQYTLEN